MKVLKIITVTVHIALKILYIIKVTEYITLKFQEKMFNCKIQEPLSKVAVKHYCLIYVYLYQIMKPIKRQIIRRHKSSATVIVDTIFQSF